MPRIALPTLAALALTGTGAGVYLGRAAVSEINPIYFSAPETRFHADLVPYRVSEAAGYRAGELSAANLDQALGRSCINCLTYPEEVVLVHRGRADKYEPGGADLAAAEPVEAEVEEAPPPPEFAAVQPYTSYPVAPMFEATEATAEAEFAAAEPVEIVATE